MLDTGPWMLDARYWMLDFTVLTRGKYIRLLRFFTTSFLGFYFV